MSRRYQITVFGATGYTGALVAAYLAREYGKSDLRWAIAGRNRSKLLAVQRRLQRIEPTCEVGVVEANVGDPESLYSMAADTEVVLTTVGPYAEHGEPVVLACVREETHYVDITGEPAFVDRLLDHYHDQAEASRIKIVNCCGFDSIPHDLGALFTVGQLPSDEPITVEGFVEASLTASGGSWHTAIGAMATYRESEKRREDRKRRRANHSGRTVRSVAPRIRYEQEVQGWVCPFPTIDPQIVKRSARAIGDFGPDFRYGHYVRVKSLPKLLAGIVGVGAMFTLSQLEATRELLYRYRGRGEGPTPEERSQNWFKVTFIGHSQTARAHTRVSGGDPGYGETAKMIAEAAYCLVNEELELPQHFGVVTPAMAFGWPLIKRLQQIGIRFEILEHSA